MKGGIIHGGQVDAIDRRTAEAYEPEGAAGRRADAEHQREGDQPDAEGAGHSTPAAGTARLIDWRQSALNQMITCPERFRRAYILGEYTGQSAASLIGTALHEAIEQVAMLYAEYGDVDPAFTSSLAGDVFDRLVEEDRSSPDPIPWGSAETIRARRDELLGMAEAWCAKADSLFARHGRPSLIEYEFQSLPLTPTSTISGIMDCGTDKEILIDWKTSKRSWPPGRADKAVQAILYSAAYELLFGRLPEWFVFVVITRAQPHRVYEYPVKITPARVEFLKQMLDGYTKQVEANIFPLNHTTALCSEDYCSFWKTCPASSR